MNYREPFSCCWGDSGGWVLPGDEGGPPCALPGETVHLPRDGTAEGGVSGITQGPAPFRRRRALAMPPRVPVSESLPFSLPSRISL